MKCTRCGYTQLIGRTVTTVALQATFPAYEESPIIPDDRTPQDDPAHTQTDTIDLPVKAKDMWWMVMWC